MLCGKDPCLQLKRFFAAAEITHKCSEISNTSLLQNSLCKQCRPTSDLLKKQSDLDYTVCDLTICDQAKKSKNHFFPCFL